MTSEQPPGLPRTDLDVRALRLGTALRGLAADLITERRKVAELRREIAQLKAQLEVRPGTHSTTPANQMPRGSLQATS